MPLDWAPMTKPPHTGTMCARGGRRSVKTNSTASKQCAAKSSGLNKPLLRDDPWLSLITSFPELARTSAELGRYEDLDPVQVSAKFVRLFQAYVCEWLRFMPHSD